METRLSELCVKVNRKPEKNILDIIDLKNRLANFNNFWQKYLETTGY